MLGAIIGDIVGSRFEFNNTSDFNFELFGKGCRFTDDTVCTVAVADAILNRKSYKDAILEWCHKYSNPNIGFSATFLQWVYSNNPQPYGSWGNGSAMRASAIGWLFDTEKEVLEQAKLSAEITHDHPEGVRGAQAVALAVFLSRKGVPKTLMLAKLLEFYPIFASPKLGSNAFDTSCQATLPVCLGIIEKANSFEEAIRYAVAVGGDSDTIACIVGAIAETIFGLPPNIKNEAIKYLSEDILTIYDKFNHTIWNKRINY